MRRTLPLLLALAALALVAAGCGSDDSSTSTSASSAPAAVDTGSATGAAAPADTAAAGEPVVVNMKNIQFEPKTVTVAPGQTIRWENLDSVDHDVKADSGADFQSDAFGQGGTYEFTPEKAGKIEYECTLHPGMVGTIEVR